MRVNKMFTEFIAKKYQGEEPCFIADNSFFLAVDLRNLENLTPQKAKYINQTYTAIELRIDFLVNQHYDKLSITDLIRELKDRISVVKFFITIPIILTLRTAKEVGSLTLILMNRVEHSILKLLRIIKICIRFTII